MRKGIRVLSLGCAVATSWMAIAAAQQPPPQRAPAAAAVNRKLALVGGMLLTGYEVPPIHHATIVVEGNKIVAAGPSSEIIVVNGNPNFDITALSRVEVVVKDGVVYKGGAPAAARPPPTASNGK